MGFFLCPARRAVFAFAFNTVRPTGHRPGEKENKDKVFCLKDKSPSDSSLLRSDKADTSQLTAESCLHFKLAHAIKACLRLPIFPVFCIQF